MARFSKHANMCRNLTRFTHNLNDLRYDLMIRTSDFEIKRQMVTNRAPHSLIYVRLGKSRTDKLYDGIEEPIRNYGTLVMSRLRKRLAPRRLAPATRGPVND